MEDAFAMHAQSAIRLRGVEWPQEKTPHIGIDARPHGGDIDFAVAGDRGDDAFENHVVHSEAQGVRYSESLGSWGNIPGVRSTSPLGLTLINRATPAAVLPP